MASTTINISIDEELLKELDAAAKAEYASRSDFIRQSVVDRIRGRRMYQSGKSEADKAWDELLAISDEIEQATAAKGLTTDGAIVRAIKDVRGEQDVDEQSLR